MIEFIVGAIVIFVLSGIKIINQFERGVKLTLGKYSGVMEPGLNVVIPVIQTFYKVDMRVITTDVPDQDCITKDNVSVRVNAVLYYQVKEADKAVLSVEYYDHAVSQLSQTTMRDIIGEVTLDELLANRDSISKRIKQIVDKATDVWGLNVSSVDLKHINLPADMQRVMAKEAESEREKRAVIIKAEGEVIAAENMSKAADMLSKSPGALHLRTLQSINDISSDKSNTVVCAIPLEVLRAFESMSKK